MASTVIFTDAMNDRIRAMHADGFGSYAISVELNVDPTTARRQIKRLGLPTKLRHREWLAWEDELLSRRYADGAAPRIIADELAHAGSERSEGAVKARLIKSGQVARKRSADKRAHAAPVERSSGWPAIRGTDEERDAEFVRLVRAAGGAPVSVKGCGWVWPYRADQHELAWRLGLLGAAA